MVAEGLNRIANRLLWIWKVEPAEESARVQGPAELRLLIGTSGEAGLIEAGSERLLTRVLELSGTPVHAVTLPLADADRVPSGGTAQDVVQAADRGGHSRLVVLDDDGVPVGLVHVRDALLADPATPVRHLAYETVRLDPHASVVEGIGRMRAQRSQLALVVDESGTVTGITALEDLVERVLGEFEDETDLPRH